MPDRELCGACPSVHGIIIPALVRDAVLGAFCLSKLTHKRTLPKNANQIKNTTKPNYFLARDDQGLHIRHEYPHPPSARLALNRSGKDDFKFSLAANSAINFILS